MPLQVKLCLQPSLHPARTATYIGVGVMLFEPYLHQHSWNYPLKSFILNLKKCSNVLSFPLPHLCVAGIDLTVGLPHGIAILDTCA